MEDAVEDAVEAPVEKLIEDEVVNAVEDPGYGKRAIELNSTCGNPEMVRADMMSRLQCLWTTYPRSHFKCLVSPLYESYKTKKLQSRDGYSDGARSTQPFGFYFSIWSCDVAIVVVVVAVVVCYKHTGG